jgi:hypothetical protein
MFSGWPGCGKRWIGRASTWGRLGDTARASAKFRNVRFIGL